MGSRALDQNTIVRVQSWRLQEPLPGRAEETLGVALPKTVGSVAVGRVDVLCVGPTDWFVIAADPDSGSLLRSLTDAFADSSYRATQVSSAYTRVEVEGQNARALLSKGCAIDMDLRAFSPGFCTRTRFAGMAVILRCQGPAAFECIVARSFRDYLMSWLADAGTEFS